MSKISIILVSFYFPHYNKMKGLAPMLPEDWKVDYLILWTFPWQKTLELKKKYRSTAYYMKENNCFWEIIGYCFQDEYPTVKEQVDRIVALKAFFSKKNDLPEDKLKEKLQEILELQQSIINITHIALWDCCESANNSSSSDNSLENIVHNELTSVFSREQLAEIAIIQNGKSIIRNKKEIYQFKVNRKLQNAQYRAYSTSNWGFRHIPIAQKMKNWKQTFEDIKRKKS